MAFSGASLGNRKLENTLTFSRYFGMWPVALALCSIWIVTGLVGHEPWKPDEAYTVGIVSYMVKHGDWVVPMLAGEPFLEKPPLFFITASLFARGFGNLLPLHEAARLAGGLYVSLALLFLSLTAGELYGARTRPAVLLAMIGCLGLIVRSHQSITDTALLAGIALGSYGLARVLRDEKAGGVALGIGATVAFLAKGLLGPGLLGISALLLALFPAWRHRSYARALVLAGLIAVPASAVWVIALYLRSPELFHTWFVTNNLDRFFAKSTIGPHNEPFFYLRTLTWYAFPALPLAAWSVWVNLRDRRLDRNASGLQLPLVVFAVMLIVLEFAHDSRELYAMPMLLPLALLAGVEIDRLPRQGVSTLTWLARAIFGGIAVVMWVAWYALVTGEPALIHDALAAFQPGFTGKLHPWSFAVAIIATLVWGGVALARARTGVSGIFQWVAGLTTCWVLVHTLWLPYVDAGKSYRAMFDSLARVLPPDGCVASIRLGEPQRAMLDYYHDIRTIRTEVIPAPPCDWLLVQGWKATGAPAPAADWIPVWEGSRSGDRLELYRLYTRGVPANHSIDYFPKR